MKRILLTLAVMVAALTGCSSEKHLEFLGIPIDGPLDEFVAKLEDCGFTLGKMKHGVGAIMHGEIEGDEYEVIVSATPLTATVWQVIATCDYKNLPWGTIKGTYHSFRRHLIDTYGMPSSNIEEFFYPYEEGDGCELYAISHGKAYFYCQFDTPEGTVSGGLLSTQMGFTFNDALNSALLETESLTY